MAPSSEVALSIRAIAIAYKFDLHLTEPEISSRLSVPERTLRDLFKRQKSKHKAVIGRSYCSISTIYQAVVENLIFNLVL